ncbi:MAG: DsbA family oxidoreductase [Bacteroidota bacterium]
MKIDIWSDIMCPFCYIGKRRLEASLEQFEHGKDVEIIWHSFQLDPGMQPAPGADLYGYLAQRKGQSREWSVGIHRQMEQNAKADGLEYNFDKAVVANSFNAHQLIQLAKSKGLGDKAEERLFRAYFTEGRDVADINTLTQLGIDIGLSAIETGEMLNNDEYAAAVATDIQWANELGITGVPFFVINDKYAISGAQPVEVFTNALQQAWVEQTAGKPIMHKNNTGNCADGSCSM